MKKLFYLMALLTIMVNYIGCSKEEITPVRHDTAKNSIQNMEHETKKNIIQNIRWYSTGMPQLSLASSLSLSS